MANFWIFFSLFRCLHSHSGGYYPIINNPNISSMFLLFFRIRIRFGHFVSWILSSLIHLNHTGISRQMHNFLKLSEKSGEAICPYDPFYTSTYTFYGKNRSIFSHSIFPFFFCSQAIFNLAKLEQLSLIILKNFRISTSILLY